MWIVRIALSRPYTFIVMALLLLILGPLTILRTPTDIFPTIGIPVIGVVWNYTGLPPEEMAGRIVSNYERALTATVNDVEHIESNSLNGIATVKVFFHPNVKIDLALSQVTSISQTVLKSFPPGATPPYIIVYNASSVPIIQLALSSATLSEQKIFDIANNFIRTQLATVEGVMMPYPYGGKSRQIQVDLDPEKLQAHGLTGQDVENAIGDQNLILPSGTEKIGQYEYNVKINASPIDVDELNDLPVKTINGTTIYVRDLGHVRDGFAPQTNIVRANGQRSILMIFMKTGNASTLDVINQIKGKMPLIKDQSPPDLDMKLLADQSLFVQGAIEGVVREAIIAAALTGLMILLFLGSWRSTIIITISIPLSILASIILLSACGETINLMTLGGLALAVGILVDDATVAIENINWHLEQGKDVEPAILDGAQQIAIPALVSTLCICIVFVPMFLLTGVARFLFVPMAEAVVFAMLASYILSRTLVPTLAKYWLHRHATGDAYDAGEIPKGPFGRFQHGFEHRFMRLRAHYEAILKGALAAPKTFVVFFLVVVVFSGILLPWIGQDFFPSVDTGQIKLHMRARSGTRVEETAALADQVEAVIRTVIPAKDLRNVVDNIGMPISGTNLTYTNSAPISSGDADILLSLNEGHRPSADYMRRLREILPQQFPGVMFAFLPADIVSQILNFGRPSPVDVQVTGFDLKADRTYADEVMGKMQHVPGIVDLRMQQTFDEPEFDIDVDRNRAEAVGLTERDVAGNLLISLSGSAQTAPSFWLSDKNGVQYSVVTQEPQYKIDSLQDLENIPVASGAGAPRQILGGMSTIRRSIGQAVVSHYNVAPVLDLYGSVQDTDLGSVTSRLEKILRQTKADIPKGVRVFLRGQIETMRDSFTGLAEGIVFAILLVYLLIVVNFQSWLDPFIIITALPAALAGIVWMLFLTGTTLSVPALTGALMCIGVATANSILVVSFARERMSHGADPMTAATEAGFTRFRPVLMTALAMIIGMVPMSLGMGDGGEQNAPLGRAVIGGLSFATIATLFFVPCVFMLIHRWMASRKTAGHSGHEVEP